MSDCLSVSLVCLSTLHWPIANFLSVHLLVYVLAPRRHPLISGHPSISLFCLWLCPSTGTKIVSVLAPLIWLSGHLMIYPSTVSVWQWLGRGFCQMGHFQLFSMNLKFSMGHFLSFYTDVNGPFSKLMGLWRMAPCLPYHWSDCPSIHRSIYLSINCYSVGGNIVMWPFVFDWVSERVRECVRLSLFALWTRYTVVQTTVFAQWLSNVTSCKLFMMRGGTLFGIRSNFKVIFAPLRGDATFCVVLVWYMYL